jgi:membrane associated rhomboid family serine protease
VFPLADENAGRRIVPAVNYGLIALNVLVQLWVSLAVPPRLLFPFFLTWGVQPREIVAFDALATLLTGMFLHAGWGHLLGNMLFLHVFGDNVEDAMGHVGYLTFYVLTGLAAAIAQVAIDPFSQTPLVGASGAVSGVLGAYIVLFPHGRVRTFIVPFFVRMLPAWIVLGLWFLFQLLPALNGLGRPSTGGVAFMAHVGGFAAGALLAKVFARPDDVRRQNAVREQQRQLDALRRGVV